jgi:xylulokinase
VKWFHDLLYGNGSAGIRGTEAEHYAFLEAHAPHGPTGLCITPNLIGTCNPDFNPNARGIIYGLNPGTGPAHIYKGILEALACELAQIARLLASAVGDFKDVYVTGGGARSVLGLKLRAALTGKRLHVMRCPGAVCLGGAILAGVATGEYASIDEALSSVVHNVAVVAPDPEIASVYANQAKQYKWLRSLAPPAN